MDRTAGRGAVRVHVNLRRVAALVLGPAVVFAPVVLRGGPAAGATACSNFNAVAAAEGVRVAVSSPGYLVVEGTDAGAPVAQVVLDSYGTSTGYAAYPDPGEEALSALPTAGDATGLPVGRDTYPLVAESQYPTAPEVSVDTPAVDLEARSQSDAASADAVSGIGGTDVLSSTGLVRASASASCVDSGEVTAIGESDVEGLSFVEGTLRIGRIHSVARVVMAPDGTVTPETDLEISQLTIAGQTVGFGPDGLSLGGTALPLGENPLAEVLAGAGMQLTYLEAAPQSDGRGAVAPAVQLTITRELTGAAPTTITYTFGRAVASVDAAAVTPAPAAAPSTAPPRVTVPPVAATGPVGPVPAVAVAPTVAAPVQPAAAAPIAAVPAGRFFTFSVWSIYAVLVVGSAVLLSSGLFFKKAGVRLRWT